MANATVAIRFPNASAHPAATNTPPTRIVQKMRSAMSLLERLGRLMPAGTPLRRAFYIRLRDTGPSARGDAAATHDDAE